VEQIAIDLAVFADIGTEPPTIEEIADGHTIHMIRNGDITELAISQGNGVVLETFGHETIKHVNFKALLGSHRYGDLRDWQIKQKIYLDQELQATGHLIDVHGLLNGNMPADVYAIDNLLALSQAPDSTRVVLIDGPAGIGKTLFIQNLAATRVDNYTKNRRPLILHVQSRGRILSYLYDLIAFTLQRLRLNVTFDQIPVLAKHGLITVAIDGFDESADPDGYDQAWAQVSDLVQLLRGSGSLVLGRSDDLTI